MQKIVINKMHGGFGLTPALRAEYEALACHGYPGDKQISRTDPTLIAVVSQDPDGSTSDLGVVEIPDDVDWKIIEFDGKEFIIDKHRVWGRE